MPTELIQYQLVRYTGSVDGKPIEQTKVFAPTPEGYLECMALQAVWVREARAAREAGKTFPSGPNENHMFGQTAAKPDDRGAGMPTTNPQYQPRRREP